MREKISYALAILAAFGFVGWMNNPGLGPVTLGVNVLLFLQAPAYQFWKGYQSAEPA